MYTAQLQRGTPEYLDNMATVSTSIDHLRSQRSMDNMYRSYNGSVVGSEAALAGEGRATLQEENDWLRSALRLAEAHIKKEKEELKSLHAIFEKSKEDYGRRALNLEDQITKRDAERRELDARVWEADEKLRSADTKLGEAARREKSLQEESRKMYENEQMRLEYIQVPKPQTLNPKP